MSDLSFWKVVSMRVLGGRMEQLFFAFFGCSIRILMRNPCVLYFKCLGRCGFHLNKFLYGDDNASPNEIHTKKNPTWQGEAAARDDGGQRTGVAERPGDWSPDDDAGEATRDYCSHDSETSLGGRPRERPPSAVGADAALCCPTVTVGRSRSRSSPLHT